jgi:hypothetical protein
MYAGRAVVGMPDHRIKRALDSLDKNISMSSVGRQYRGSEQIAPCSGVDTYTHWYEYREPCARRHFIPKPNLENAVVTPSTPANVASNP